MKNKVGMLLTILFNLIYFLIIIKGILSIFNFQLPNEITKDEFEHIMKNINCNIVEVEQSNTLYDTYLSTDTNCPYLINYVYSNEKEDLQNLFINLATDALQNNNNITGKTDLQILSDYYEYSTSGEYYKFVLLNKNTLLYSSVKKRYRNDIINLFDTYRYNISINFTEISRMIYCVIGMLFVILMVSLCFIENKIRNKWWIGLIPFYNIWCLSEDTFSNHWYSLLLFVPILNVLFMYILIYNLCKLFDKKESFRILSILFPNIMLPIIAFDNSKYIKRSERNESNR